ncbi:alpha/beta fold hydrolase [Kribbella sp. NPDC004138]
MRRIVAGVHIALAALHVYWATGATWPAGDERSLSLAVLNAPVSFAPAVVLPLAALHLFLAGAVLTSARWSLSRLVVGGLAAGLAARAAVGLVWITGAGDAGRAFYWLNLVLYTPLCIALCLADLKMLRMRRLKVAVVAGPVAVVLVGALVAYGYQPTEQPHPSASADSRYLDTPLARMHYLQRGNGSPVVLLAPGALGQFLDALHLQSVALAGNSWSGGWGLAYAQRHPDLVTPQLVDAMWIPGTYRDNVRSLYALERGLDWSVTERALPSTRQPTLVVWGDHDTILPVEQAARFGKLLPNATVYVLPGCGHALTGDCPGQVSRLLAAFVE